MELDWSEQSPHIRTLYHPWQPGDGYEESAIAAAEDRPGIRLPAPLRSFYQTWGRRKEMTRLNHPLLGPASWILRPDALIFCVENQATGYWAILREDLGKVNPAVVRAWALPDWEAREIASPLTWEPSHAHVSDFLDTLTYHHALCGGAIHGGWTELFFHHQKSQDAWLEQHWHRIPVGALVFGLDDGAEAKYDLPFYVRDGQALAWFWGCSVAARSAEVLDEIGQALQVTWEHRW